MALDTHDPRWLDYLFYGHPRAELRSWSRRLRYFRFCKAYGGHANDGDHLLTALRYADNADLRHLLAQLGLSVAESADVLQAGGRAVLAGEAAFVWVRHLPVQQLEISLADPDAIYEVTARTVVAAESIEKLLITHQSRIIDPPQPNRNCVCPTYYPELWAEPAEPTGPPATGS